MKNSILLSILFGITLLTACGNVISAIPTSTSTFTPTASPPPTIIPTPTQSPLAITSENAKNVTELNRWGQGKPHEIDWSPDGNELAITSSIGIYLYNSQTLAQEKLIHLPHAFNSTFSPDSQFIAISGCSSYDPYHTCNGAWIKLVDIKSEKIIFETNPGYGNEIAAIEFSPDGKLLAATGCNDERGPGVHCIQGKISVIDIKTGKIFRDLVGHDGYVNSAAISQDGQFLVSSSRGNLNTNKPSSVILWDLKTGRQVKTITEANMNSSFHFAAFKQDENEVVIGDGEGNIKTWNPKNGQVLQTFQGNNLSLPSFSIIRSINLLVISDPQPVIQFCDLDSGQLSFDFIPPGKITSIAPGPTGDELAGLSDNKIIIWDLKTKEIVRSLDWETAFRIKTSGQLPNGQWVVIGKADNAIYLLDGLTGNHLQTFDIPNDNEPYKTDLYPYNFAISPNGRMLAYGDDARAGLLRIWDLQTGQLLVKKDGEAASVVTFSPDSRFLAAGGSDGNLKLWDASNLGKSMAFVPLSGHTGHLEQVIFSRDGKYLLSVAGSGAGENQQDYTLRIWEMPSGRLLHTLRNYFLSHTTLSPDNHSLAGSTSFTSGHVELFDLAPVLSSQTGSSEMPYIQDDYGQFTSFAFNPSGTVLAWGKVETEDESDIILWDVTKRQAISRLSGHTSWVNFLAFSPDGRYLISSSADGTTCLWGLK